MIKKYTHWASRAVKGKSMRGKLVGSLFLTSALNAVAASAVADTCTPVTIEAENWAYMSGVQTEPTSDAGGGMNVGWLDAGDWMSYTADFPVQGRYSVAFRVASTQAGATLRLETNSGSTLLSQVTLPNTGGWQNWTTVNVDVDIPFAGVNSVGLAVASPGFNINWISFTPKQCAQAIDAKQAAQEMGKGFNLGQMFESTQHPRTFAAAKAKIDAYYAKGFRTVRIPVTWTENVGGDMLVYSKTTGQVNRNHPRLQVIQQVVDYALSLPGLYVVLNAHHEVALKDYSRANVLERLWADIADIFRDRSNFLLYEILNEPHRSDASHSPMPAGDLRYMTGLAYQKIRAVNPQRIVIIGGNQWFGYHEMAATWPHLNDVGGGNDAYVMSTFHHYNPWEFNGDNQGSYDDAWTNYDLVNPMDVMQNWANTVGGGMPVYIGEWGVGWGSRYTTMQCNNVRLWYQMFYQDVARYKTMPSTVWDDGGWFKIFDHGTNSFANNLADCISGSCAWDNGERFNSACW